MSSQTVWAYDGKNVISDKTPQIIAEIRGYGFLTQEEIDRNGHVIAAAPQMYDAMCEFVDRCEKGEIRSKYTYNLFKKILNKAQGVK